MMRIYMCVHVLKNEREVILVAVEEDVHLRVLLHRLERLLVRTCPLVFMLCSPVRGVLKHFYDVHLYQRCFW